MISQSTLELQIADLKVQLAQATAELDSARQDQAILGPAVIRQLELNVASLQKQLGLAEGDLSGFSTLSPSMNPEIPPGPEEEIIYRTNTQINTAPIVGGIEPPIPSPQTTIDAESQADIARFAQAAAASAPIEQASASKGLTDSRINTQSQGTKRDAADFAAQGDWRVRLALAPGADYLYKAANPGILAPLQSTDGVVFPYVPSISVSYQSNYDATELTHSNYKFFMYKGSAVDSISITGDFTAQDSKEADYLLAVIHFFRSVTKMFYGQDQGPKPGTPPPLCYLYGMGAYQFDKHPMAITAFTYNLPTDVDYVRAGSTPTPQGVNKAPQSFPSTPGSISANRLKSSVIPLAVGGISPPANFSNNVNPTTKQPTYVPTKIQIQINAVPIVSRNDVSNNFSLRKYATGELLRGSINRAGKTGGIW